MNFKRHSLVFASAFLALASTLSPSHANGASKAKIPAGYTKWKDGSQFAYKWITRTPKDDYYMGTWQGVASAISVQYVNGFSCSPELPDGTTNSVEVEMDVIRTGNKGFSGRGHADTIRNSGPFKIEITFYGAPKGYGSAVKRINLRTIECRM